MTSFGLVNGQHHINILTYFLWGTDWGQRHTWALTCSLWGRLLPETEETVEHLAYNITRRVLLYGDLVWVGLICVVLLSNQTINFSSWEANGSSAGQGIPHTQWNMQVTLTRLQNCTYPYRKLGKSSQHSPIPFINTYFSIILSSTTR